MSNNISAPLLHLPGRHLILDRNLHGASLHVTHEAGVATLNISWPAEESPLPRPAVDPIGRCPELDAWLPHELTVRPPTATTAWLRTPGDLLVGLCLASGDLHVLLPLDDDTCVIWEAGLDLWTTCGPALRHFNDVWGIVVRAAGTPSLHDWWWSLAPAWLNQAERGRYVIPGVIAEQTAAAALWTAVGDGKTFSLPLLPLNDVAFTPQVEIRAQWHYEGQRFTWWTDHVATVASVDHALEEGWRPPTYSPFVLPKVDLAVHPGEVKQLVEHKAQSGRPAAQP